MNPPFPLDDIVRQLDVPGVRAVALMGSYARGDDGPYSDVDLVRLVDGTGCGPMAEEHRLGGGSLIVISTVTPAHVEGWFGEPEMAVNAILGVRQARALQDREGYFAAIQARARAFTWDARMQERANRWASRQMVGWIEDNAFYYAVAASMGSHAEWMRLCRAAFGIEAADGRASTLREQVVAGLRLYALTAELLGPALCAEDLSLIIPTCALINATLGQPRQR